MLENVIRTLVNRDVIKIHDTEWLTRLSFMPQANFSVFPNMNKWTITLTWGITLTVDPMQSN